MTEEGRTTRWRCWDTGTSSRGRKVERDVSEKRPGIERVKYRHFSPLYKKKKGEMLKLFEWERSER